MAGRDLGAVGGEAEAGVGAKVGGDLFGFEFVDIQKTGAHRGIVDFEVAFDLVPSPELG